MHASASTATPITAHDLSILADEITELAAHLNAATYRLLTLTQRRPPGPFRKAAPAPLTAQGRIGDLPGS